jgi:hypothetical protein
MPCAARVPEATTLNNLGEGCWGLGRCPNALDHYGQSGAPCAGDRRLQHRRLCVGLRRRHAPARALAGIAHTLRAANHLSQASRYWRRALSAYTELGVPEVAEVIDILANMRPAGAP